MLSYQLSFEDVLNETFHNGTSFVGFLLSDIVYAEVFRYSTD